MNNRCRIHHEYFDSVKLLRRSDGKLYRYYYCPCGCCFQEEVPE